MAEGNLGELYFTIRGDRRLLQEDIRRAREDAQKELGRPIGSDIRGGSGSSHGSGGGNAGPGAGLSSAALRYRVAEARLRSGEPGAIRELSDALQMTPMGDPWFNIAAQRATAEGRLQEYGLLGVSPAERARRRAYASRGRMDALGRFYSDMGPNQRAAAEYEQAVGAFTPRSSGLESAVDNLVSSIKRAADQERSSSRQQRRWDAVEFGLYRAGEQEQRKQEQLEESVTRERFRTKMQTRDHVERLRLIDEEILRAEQRRDDLYAQQLRTRRERESLASNGTPLMAAGGGRMAMFQAMFGGWEVSQSGLALMRAGRSGRLSTPEEQLAAYEQVITSGGSGVFGGPLMMAAELGTFLPRAANVAMFAGGVGAMGVGLSATAGLWGASALGAIAPWLGVGGAVLAGGALLSNGLNELSAAKDAAEVSKAMADFRQQAMDISGTSRFSPARQRRASLGIMSAVMGQGRLAERLGQIDIEAGAYDLSREQEKVQLEALRGILQRQGSSGESATQGITKVERERQAAASYFERQRDSARRQDAIHGRMLGFSANIATISGLGMDYEAELASQIGGYYNTIWNSDPAHRQGAAAAANASILAWMRTTDRSAARQLAMMGMAGGSMSLGIGGSYLDSAIMGINAKYGPGMGSFGGFMGEESVPTHFRRRWNQQVSELMDLEKRAAYTNEARRVIQFEGETSIIGMLASRQSRQARLGRIDLDYWVASEGITDQNELSRLIQRWSSARSLEMTNQKDELEDLSDHAEAQRILLGGSFMATNTLQAQAFRIARSTKRGADRDTEIAEQLREMGRNDLMLLQKQIQRDMVMAGGAMEINPRNTAFGQWNTSDEILRDMLLTLQSIEKYLSTNLTFQAQ